MSVCSLLKVNMLVGGVAWLRTRSRGLVLLLKLLLLSEHALLQFLLDLIDLASVDLHGFLILMNLGLTLGQGLLRRILVLIDTSDALSPQILEAKARQ